MTTLTEVVKQLFELYKRDRPTDFANVAYSKIRAHAEGLGDGKLKKVTVEDSKTGYITSHHLPTIQNALGMLKRMFIENSVRHKDYPFGFDKAASRSIKDRNRKREFMNMPLKQQLEKQHEIVGKPTGFLGPQQYKQWFEGKLAQLDAIDRRIAEMQLLPNEILQLELPPTDVEKLEDFRDAVRENKKAAVFEWTHMQDVLNLLLSPQAEAQLVGLLYATGRRPTEVLKTGVFKKIKGEEYFAHFSGQLKKRGAPDEEIRIPLLAPIGIVQSALNSVRAALDTDKVEVADMNRKYAMKAKRAAEKYAKIRPAYLCRSLYASTCLHFFARDQNPAKYIGKILNHESFGTAGFYMDGIVRIPTDAKLWAPDKTVLKDRLADEVKQIAWRTNNKLPQLKKVDVLNEFIKTGKYLNVDSVRQFAKGNGMGPGEAKAWKELLEQNSDLVDKYNDWVQLQ